MSKDELDMKRNPLEEIAESNECNMDDENENYDEEKEEKADKIILELQEKIVLLEKANKDLKTKLESTTKKQTLNSTIIMRMAAVGLRKKFMLKSDTQNDSVKLAEVMKEKDELQQINEKMLDMLTEKELEIDELNENFEKYKLEQQMENEKNLEQIKNLEEKIEALEDAQNENQLDDLYNEFDIQREKLMQQINDCTKLEEELNNQIEEKDNKIKKLNEEIQNLQFENLRLLDKSDEQDKINQAGFMDMQKITEENNKYKSEIETLSNELKKKKKEIKTIDEEKTKEIEKYQEEIEKLKKNIESKIVDINKLNEQNTKLNATNKEVNTFLVNMEKKLNEEKEKCFKVQSKLDKNTKELKNMNDYYKTLKTNNDNLLSQYQQKIDELTQEKTNLISQNKELLEKLKEKKEQEEEPGTNLADMMGEEEEEKEKEEKKEESNEDNAKIKEELSFYKNENKLLTEEVKGLKEQLNNQAHDLVDLNTLEKKLEQLKGENEALINNNKELKNNLEKERQKLKQKELTLSKPNQKEDNLGLKKLNAFRRVATISRKEKAKTVNIEKDKLLLQKNIEMLKKLKEDEKKYYEAQIEKIKIDMSMLKVKFLNKQYEDDTLLLKYKNTIKAISTQCKIKGIKLSLNLISV